MTDKGKIHKDKGGRPYRIIDGVKTYLTWEESYKRLQKQMYGLQKDLHRAAIGEHVFQDKIRYKQTEIDKLKRDLMLYQVAYLKDKEPLRDAILKIGRVINERERYTKKQMMDRIEDILIGLGTNVPEEEFEKPEGLE